VKKKGKRGTYVRRKRRRKKKRGEVST